MDDRSGQISYSSPPPSYRSGQFDLLAAASEPPRLAILATLCEIGELEIDELSARVEDRNGRPGDDSREYRAPTPVDLHHVHLPKLAAADLVEVDDDGVSVRPGPAFDVDVVESLERDAEAGALDGAAVAALGEPRRRRIISALADSDGPVALDELAAAVSARISGSARSNDPLPDAEIVLHHVDLPALDAAGIVDYDQDEGRVTYLGLPDALASAVPDA